MKESMLDLRAVVQNKCAENGECDHSRLELESVVVPALVLADLLTPVLIQQINSVQHIQKQGAVMGEAFEEMLAKLAKEARCARGDLPN